MADCFFNGVDYLVLEWHKEGILCYQHFDKFLRCEIWSIDIPTKHLLVFFAIWFKLQMDGDQILFILKGSFLFAT